MYLIDTNVISEARKRSRADPGVTAFFRRVQAAGEAVYLSAITVGELRRGIELVRYRGDRIQAARLQTWFERLLTDHANAILAFDADVAQVWGHLRAPHAEHPLDKQIAATALVYDLTLVTRNLRDFAGTGVRLLCPFEGPNPPGV